VIESITDYCQRSDIEILVVAGFGYSHYETLTPYSHVKIIRNSTSIAELMREADVIFTSAGRTTYEAASLKVPTIVLAQNERELTHFFATAEHGFLNLGLGTEVSNKQILNAFESLSENFQSRQYASGLMAKADLHSGRQRVLKLINSIVEQV
jgi:spore coat polysaccharide biosynthesis predicted glycosyltransferase SpsG